MKKKLQRPSGGEPPPTEAKLRDGTVVALLPLAVETTDRYARTFPDEDARYTSEWRQWSTHDNQHVLRWAISAQTYRTDLWKDIAWLARVLEARGFPLDRLAKNLELLADVLTEQIGAPVAVAAQHLRKAAANLATADPPRACTGAE